MEKSLYEEILILQDLSEFDTEKLLHITLSLNDLSVLGAPRNPTEKTLHDAAVKRFIVEMRSRKSNQAQSTLIDLAEGAHYQDRAKNCDEYGKPIKANIEKSLFFYRKALRSAGFPLLRKKFRSLIYSEIANRLCELSRSVEALPYWELAMRTYPKNRKRLISDVGFSIYCYSIKIADYTFYQLMRRTSYEMITESLQGELLPNWRSTLNKTLSCLSEDLEFLKYPSIDEFKPRRVKSAKEIRKQAWASKRRLSLNPLNDLKTSSTFGDDHLVLPPLTEINEEMLHYLVNCFEAIKHEYLFSRLLFKNATGFQHKKSELKIRADIECSIALSHQTENLRISFQKAYAILDKIALFINDYLEWNLPRKKINFRLIWQSEPFQRSMKDQSKKESLCALYYLSKDIYPGTSDHDPLEPRAKKLSEVRNHLEHRQLWLYPAESITKGDWAHPSAFSNNPGVLVLSIEEFSDQCKYLLKTVRASIIYLTCMSVEREQQKLAKRGIKGIPRTWHPEY